MKQRIFVRDDGVIFGYSRGMESNPRLKEVFYEDENGKEDGQKENANAIHGEGKNANEGQDASKGQELQKEVILPKVKSKGRPKKG